MVEAGSNRLVRSFFLQRGSQRAFLGRDQDSSSDHNNPSNVTNDAEVVSLFFTNAVSQIIRAFVQIFMILIVMFFMNWRLTIVALVTVPLLLGAVYLVARIASPAFTRRFTNTPSRSRGSPRTLSWAALSRC